MPLLIRQRQLNLSGMIEVRAPARLHFGLLAHGPGVERGFGGLGLMVHEPSLRITAEPAETTTASGPMGERAERFAAAAARRLQDTGWVGAATGAAIRVHAAPRAHAGLGTGTQLGLATAWAVAAVNGVSELGPAELAALADRGRRSAIGTYGFFRGGLLVDGGKQAADRLAPLIARHAFPDAWRLVLVTPHHLTGRSGAGERRAFSEMPAFPVAETDRMCRLVTLGLLPAAAERDHGAFAAALGALQETVGRCFAAAQGGRYADPGLADIAEAMRGWGHEGVGQSSWGPTVYAVTPDASAAEDLAARVRERFGLGADEVVVTRAANDGARARPIEAPVASP